MSEQVQKKANTGIERRTIALLFGYLGSNYQGLQINPRAHTVEAVLYVALCRAGVIEADADTDAPDLAAVGWQRTARTDKGVHAAGGIVSFRARIVDDLVDRVNAALPYDVRVFGYRFTTNRFKCKEQCEARTYEMRVPSFVLLTPTPTDAAEFDAYRVPPERLDVLRRTLKMFEGTHNFHNYTSGRSPSDPSCKRFMRAVDVLDPVVISGIEFFTVRLLGQSFMLHQIRKMVGTAVMLMRYELPAVCLKRTLTQEKFSLPLIPGVGLAVVRCWFTGYDARVAAGQEGFGKRDMLTWEEEQPLVEAYIRDVIVPHVASLEHGDYQEERNRQRRLWREHLESLKAASTAATTVAAAPVENDNDAVVGDEDDDDGHDDDDDGDDDKPAKASATTMRAQDKPSKVRTSRKHPFKHWCSIVDKYPPSRANYLLHAALRPIGSVAVLGSANEEPSLVLYFNAEMLRQGDTDRYAAGPVRVTGSVLVGGNFLNRTLELGVARSSVDEQPAVTFARIEPQAAVARIEVDYEFASDSASLVPYETISLLGRYLLVVDGGSRELLSRSVIGVARVETFEEAKARLEQATTTNKA
jgi:tRNA pseudouridine38-40 synthase